MTLSTLDAYARQSGGYVAAAQLERDIADQYRALGDPDTDRLSAHHDAVADALLARLRTLTPQSRA